MYAFESSNYKNSVQILCDIIGLKKTLAYVRSGIYLMAQLYIEYMHLTYGRLACLCLEWPVQHDVELAYLHILKLIVAGIKMVQGLVSTRDRSTLYVHESIDRPRRFQFGY